MYTWYVMGLYMARSADQAYLAPVTINMVAEKVRFTPPVMGEKKEVDWKGKCWK